MNSLAPYISEYLRSLAPAYFMRQYAVIIGLFVFGAILSDALLGNDEKWLRRCVLAYPVGVAAFSVTGYAMLVIGIPYNTLTVCLAVLLEACAAVSVRRKSFAASARSGWRHMIPALGAVLVLAAVATSGILPVSVSNDSMYYFKRYPDCIVYFGGLRDQFDFWLTDTGLGIVSFETLPALFGFGESFGIREFFHMNFIAFFALAAYERAGRYTARAKAAAAAATLLLVISTPFVILGHWALANMYFMEMFFIAAYSAVCFDCGGIRAHALLMVALSLFRIEGTIFVVWLILCVSLYREENRKLSVYAVVPMMVLFGGYCLKIFTQFYVFDNTYLFLTPVKATFLIAAMGAAAVYVAKFQPALKKKMPAVLPWAYLAALAAGNILLLIADSEHYIGNLRAFYANLFRQSGWGMFPYFAVAASVFIAAQHVIMRIKRRGPAAGADRFSLVLALGFVLIVLAASFGRGDVLAEDMGDSGNRVMLQVVPLAVIAFAELFLELIAGDDGGNKEM
ncbi:MAG: hypothetical protein K6G58_11110 [Lachnospiraceae bacterium]|nr:hypothetical protein [Lachnospiraceae bacterium]